MVLGVTLVFDCWERLCQIVVPPGLKAASVALTLTYCAAALANLVYTFHHHRSYAGPGDAVAPLAR